VKSDRLERHIEWIYELRTVSLHLPHETRYSNEHVSWLRLPRVLKYSLLSLSDCKFPFHVAVFCSHLMNCWNLWKLGVSWFHLQLVSLLFSNLAWNLALDRRAAR